jgi:Cu(I)/Ag(I) efflux system membrane fusion protein
MALEERDPVAPERRRSWQSWLIALLLTGAIGAFALYAWRPRVFQSVRNDTAKQMPKAEPQKEEYYCPMHPQQKSDKPGNCPICSMKLVKVEPHPMETAQPASAAIFISPERQQLIGVTTVAVAARPLVKQIRAAGKVAMDETRITHIHTKVSGFVEEVFVDFVGKAVKRGEPLFTIYSPDLVATQEEYLLALRSSGILKDSAFPWISNGSKNLVEAAGRRLRLWDISEEEIQQLEKEGKPKRALTVFSPVGGVVTERAAYHHGKSVTPEMDLYTIVDLSTVWVLGQVYESELPYIRVGQTVRVELPYAGSMKGRSAKVAFVSPTLDPQTRTASVRVELSNADLSLRPDAFVNFLVRVDLGSPLVVPSDAVIDTGAEQYVFVDKGQGYFEPRSVKRGAEADGYSGIESGLKAGERVVTAANFILDSESRLKGAFANMGAPSTRPAPALSVEILEPRTAKTGMNNLRLVAKDARGNPVADADVDVTLFMPQMGSMAPMRSAAKLRHMGNGEYAGQVEVPMAWTWETTVTASKNGEIIGSAKTSITAR